MEETWDGGSHKQEALAVQKVGNNYKLVVRDTFAADGTADSVFYLVYTLGSDGKLDYNAFEYVSAADLNEVEFGQDITGDGVTSAGSSSSASGTNVTTNTDAQVQEKFGSIAQSDIVAISNYDSSSSDSIEMFVKGVDGSAKTTH